MMCVYTKSPALVSPRAFRKALKTGRKYAGKNAIVAFYKKKDLKLHSHHYHLLILFTN
jgi:hypothetical protein